MFTPPAPYKLVDNTESLLDKSDLVFIDAMGTGYSHAVCKAQEKDFYGIDEDVQVIKRGEQPQVARHQHAVAEYVARHVADTDHTHLARLDVAPEFTEMAFDEFPGAARGDAHCLVVVSRRTARRKRIAEQEPVLMRDRVGEIGEGRGSLVGRDHEIGVVAVIPDDLGRQYDPVPPGIFRDNVVGEIQEAADQRLVAFDRFGPQAVG